MPEISNDFLSLLVSYSFSYDDYATHAQPEACLRLLIIPRLNKLTRPFLAQPVSLVTYSQWISLLECWNCTHDHKLQYSCTRIQIVVLKS